MDEMRIRTRLMKGILEKLVKMTIKKKLGYNIDIQLNDLVIVNDGSKARIHLDADAELKRDELSKILDSVGLT